MRRAHRQCDRGRPQVAARSRRADARDWRGNAGAPPRQGSCRAGTQRGRLAEVRVAAHRRGRGSELERSLALMGAWMGQAQTGELSLYKDFGVHTLAEATADLLLELNLNGKLPDETLFEELQRRDIISPDRKWADEKNRLPDPVAKAPAPKPKQAPLPPEG